MQIRLAKFTYGTAHRGPDAKGPVLAGPWFAKCVRDIRMLRIEENNNLMPAIGQQQFDLGTAAAEGVRK